MNENELFAQNMLASTKEGNIKWEKIDTSDGIIKGAFKTTHGLSDGYQAYLLQLCIDEREEEYLLIVTKDGENKRAISSLKMQNSNILPDIFKLAKRSNSMNELKKALYFIREDAKRTKKNTDEEAPHPPNEN